MVHVARRHGEQGSHQTVCESPCDRAWPGCDHGQYHSAWCDRHNWPASVSGCCLSQFCLAFLLLATGRKTDLTTTLHGVAPAEHVARGHNTVRAGLLSDEDAAAVGPRIPSGRMGTPQDIGAVAVFLASDEAEYVTGSVVNCDGGWAGSLDLPP